MAVRSQSSTRNSPKLRTISSEPGAADLSHLIDTPIEAVIIGTVLCDDEPAYRQTRLLEPADFGLPDLTPQATCGPPSLELTRYTGSAGGAVVAEAAYIGSAGPVVRIELKREDNGQMLEAEISRERFQELGLVTGDKVNVKPRKLRIFERGKAAPAGTQIS